MNVTKHISLEEGAWGAVPEVGSEARASSLSLLVNAVLEILATAVKQEENIRGTGISKKGKLPVFAGGTNPEDLRFSDKNNSDRERIQ